MRQELEYKVVQTHSPSFRAVTPGQTVNTNPEDALNEAAKEGWDLYLVAAYSRADGSATVNHYLRRKFGGGFAPSGSAVEVKD